MMLSIALFMGWLKSAVALALAGVIVARCVSVINCMHLRGRDRPYMPWLMFGGCYSLLAMASLGSAAHIIEGYGTAGDWIWLCASCGLIVFDRRKWVIDRTAAQ